MIDIERLRALEKAVELVAKANVPELEPFGGEVSAKDGDVVADCYYNAAHENDAEDVSSAIVAAVNFIREHGSALIAELGQEVGAVADGELSEIVEDMRTCARWYEGTYAANRVAHWANRLACIQSANGLSSLDRYLESGAVQEDASRPLLAARETEDDGAAIMGRLARALAKADPSSKLPHTAIDWLRGQGVHWKSHCPTDPLHDFGEPTSPAHTSEARDAVRYRWLRRGLANTKLLPDGVADLFANALDQNDATKFDEAIDAAMRQEAE